MGSDILDGMIFWESLHIRGFSHLYGSKKSLWMYLLESIMMKSLFKQD